MRKNRSVKKQTDKRKEISEELLESICDRCRLPDILDEDALPAACDECEIGELIMKML